MRSKTERVGFTWLGTWVEVEGLYSAGCRATDVDPGEPEDFEVESVATEGGDDITEMLACMTIQLGPNRSRPALEELAERALEHRV